jgi:hypothetical protein
MGNELSDEVGDREGWGNASELGQAGAAELEACGRRGQGKYPQEVQCGRGGSNQRKARNPSMTTTKPKSVPVLTSGSRLSPKKAVDTLIWWLPKANQSRAGAAVHASGRRFRLQGVVAFCFLRSLVVEIP